MRRRHLHSRAWRLLACTSAALAFVAAYANAAQAGLEGITGQQVPVSTTVGTATSPVTDVTATVAGTVETATSAAAPVSTAVEPTVSSATGAVANSTQTVSDTAQAASSTVDQTIAAEGTVGPVVSSPTSMIEQAAPAVDSVASGSFATPAPTQSTAPASAGSDPGPPGSDTVPVPAPSSEPVVASTRVDSGRAGPPPTSNRRPPSPALRVTGARTAGQMGFATAKQATTPHDLAAARRPPLAPIPNAPSSITSLLGSSGASASFVFAALLGAMLLAAFGRPGSRLRLSPEVFRPPDVLFQLERPG